MRTIKIYCASDRLNYGDLLFPLIIKKILSEKCSGDIEIKIIGTVKSDLSKYGALKTEPYKALWDFNNNDKEDVLIIGGGEVLETEWASALSFLSSIFYNIYHRVPFKGLLNRFAQKYIGNTNEPLPFVPSSTEILENHLLIYNAVGGGKVSESKYSKIIKKSIESSVYASFRNESIYKDVKTNFTKVNPVLSPDSALIMSDVFTQIKSQSKVDYISFQVGYFKSMNKLKLIANQLNELQKLTNMEIVLTPIGFCPGHDDLKALKIIKAYVENPKIKIRSEKNIFSLMELIAGSKLYIGTSLHGVITAMSFGIPYIGLNPNIKKLDDYLNTWGFQDLKGCTEYKNIVKSAVPALKVEKEKLLAHSKKQKDIIYSSFSNMANVINQSE